MNMNKFWQSKLAIAMACAFFGTVLAQGSVSEASTLYPGMGKKPASSWHKADTPSKSEATATKKTSSWKGNNAGSTANQCKYDSGTNEQLKEKLSSFVCGCIFRLVVLHGVV